MKIRAPIIVADEAIKAGQSRCVKLSLTMLYTSTPIEIPVYVFHGKKKAPFCLSLQLFMVMKLMALKSSGDYTMHHN